MLTKWFDFDRRNTNVQPRDVKYLKEYYENYRTKQDKSDPNVYQLAEFYVKQNPYAHFIFDEVPILRQRSSGPTKYSKDSIKEAEQFVLNCLSLVKEPNLLWIAFQSNSLVDVVENCDDFQPALLRMKENLNNKGFHLASLGSNMRSTREISKLQVKCEGGDWGMKEYISTLKSSITGELPVLIRLHKKDQNTKLKVVLQEVLRPNKTGKDNNWVVLHDSGFNSYELEQELVKVGLQKDIKLYANDKDEKDNLIDLEYFLNHDNTILIVEDKFFTGCETTNVLYLCKGYLMGVNKSLRCTLFRAVEHLITIFLFSDEDSLNFDGFCVETKYLTCDINLCNRYYYECNTCRLKNVCTSCQYSCHYGHDLNRLYTEEDIKCKCYKKSCKTFVNKTCVIY